MESAVRFSGGPTPSARAVRCPGADASRCRGWTASNGAWCKLDLIRIQLHFTGQLFRSHGASGVSGWGVCVNMPQAEGGLLD